MRKASVIVLTLLLGAFIAELAQAAIAARATSTAALAGTTLPVTFQAGTSGSTTLGANATRATTTFTGIRNPTAVPSALVVRSGSTQPQVTSLRLVSTTGLANIRQATIVLGGTTEISIVEGIIVQASGAEVPLIAGGTLTISGTLRERTGSTSTIEIEVVTKAATAPRPTLVEKWTLVMVA